MLTLKEDLFTALHNGIVPDVRAICCTTNCVVTRKGELVMGAGIAKVFARKYPFLPKEWGLEQSRIGYLKPKLMVLADNEPGHLLLIAFPTKTNWKHQSKLWLIEKSTKELRHYFDENGISGKCLLPKPGCSNGGLNWEDVRPILERYLDDRFIVCLNED